MSSVFDEITIVKRSGQRVAFNSNKIAVAIKNAFDTVYDNYNRTDVNKVYESVLSFIANEYKERKTINVEDIQDIIEKKLKEEKFYDVFVAFNNYRLRRASSREAFAGKQQHKFVKTIEKLVLDVKNSNQDKPLNILTNFGKTVANDFAKSYLIDNKFTRIHEEGIININNLDYYALGVPVNVSVDLTKTNNLSTKNYFDELAKILFGLKKEVIGEINIPAIDYFLTSWLISEFKKIFKNNLNKCFTYNGFINFIDFPKIEKIILDNINSLKFDLKIFDKFIVNDELERLFKKTYEDAIINTKVKLINKLKILLKNLEYIPTYLNSNKFSISLGTNTDNEGKMINECLLMVIKDLNRLENVSLIFKLMKNINVELDSTNYYLTEMVAKLIVEGKNILLANQNANYYKKYLNYKDYKTETEYFSTGDKVIENICCDREISNGRFVISSTSLNLTRLGLKHRTNKLKDFYEDLENVLEIIKNELKDTFELMANKNKNNFDYLFKNNLIFGYEKLENNEKIRKALKNGSLNINLSGLMECAIALNKNDYYNLSVEILSFIRKKINEFSKESKLNFTISETNKAKILKDFEALDISIYGKVIDITDKNYERISKKINNLELEHKYHSYFNGGFCSFIEISKKYSWKKVIEIINKMIDFDIGFLRIETGLKDG